MYRHVELDQPGTKVPIESVLLRREIVHLGRRRAGQRGLKVVGWGEASAHQDVVVRIDDLPF